MRTLHLDGEWSLRQARRTGPVKAIVPGTVHTDLISDRKIPDPYYRDNEDSLLDTLAAIKIKWREIARTDNLFRTYEFDVEPAHKKALTPLRSGSTPRFLISGDARLNTLFLAKRSPYDRRR